MKKVLLKKMVIDNFKCISHKEIAFDDAITMITGPNGSGKTTIYDAYCWVFQNCDSEGVSQFKVQPLDADSNVLEKVNTSVRLEFLVDDVKVVLERSLSQKWRKPRNSETEVFSGTDSTYCIDSVPMGMTEYYNRISEIFCSNQDIRLLSSVYPFFSLSKEEKRRKLMEMAGDIEDILTSENYPALYEEYLITKSVDGVKKKAAYALKELKDSLASIPTKKTENERSLPTDIDFDSLKKEKEDVENEISSIDDILQKSSASSDAVFEQSRKITDEISKVNSKLIDIEMEITSSVSKMKSDVSAKISSFETEIRSLEGQKRMLESNLVELDMALSKYITRREELAKQWRTVKDSTMEFNVEQKCPTCGKPYTKEEMEETFRGMQNTFNEGKVATLKTIVNEGNRYKELIEKTTADRESTSSSINGIVAKIEAARKSIEKVRESLKDIPSIDSLKSNNSTYKGLIEKIDELRTMQKNLTSQTTDDNSALKSRKVELKQKLVSIIREISKEQLIEMVDKRRKELDEEAKQISIDMARQERILSEVRAYQKAHITLVEEEVSKMFKMLRFQMYERNVTNDGEKEMCECLINGVPYSTNVNTAARINAGVDFINALSRCIGICMPMWVDNKESVTKLIDTPSQLITMTVDGGQKQITII